MEELLIILLKIRNFQMQQFHWLVPYVYQNNDQESLMKVNKLVQLLIPDIYQMSGTVILTVLQMHWTKVQ